jgi:hypothetical protein
VAALALGALLGRHDRPHAALRKNGPGDSATMPTDIPVINGSELIDAALRGPSGSVVGAIRTALLDPASGEIESMVVQPADQAAGDHSYVIVAASRVHLSPARPPVVSTDIGEGDFQKLARVGPGAWTRFPVSPTAPDGWFEPRHRGERSRMSGRGAQAAGGGDRLLSLRRLMHATVNAAVGAPLGTIADAAIERDHLRVVYVLIGRHPESVRQPRWLPVPYAALAWLDTGRFIALSDPATVADIHAADSLRVPDRISTASLDDLYSRFGFSFNLAASP